jgi:5-methylcytosine-specific restriction endonuclease McrA
VTLLKSAANNKIGALEYQRQYMKNNKDKIAIYRNKSRAIKKKLENNLTLKQWDFIKQHFNNCCAYCGEEKPLAQEHFIPLSKDREYTHNNIIPACKSCNSSKSDSDFYKWYLKQKYYSKKRKQKILEFLNYKNGTQQLTIYLKGNG